MPDTPSLTHPAPIGRILLTAFPLRLELRAPMRLASETITHAETLLVRARDDAGLEGWGEASAAPTMTGEVLPGMAHVLTHHLAPALTASAGLTVMEAITSMARAIRGNTGAKAAAEIALLDLLARRASLSFGAFLGVPLRSEAPALLMIGGGEAHQAITAAQAGWAAGYRHFKLKVGLQQVGADADTVRALRAALGPAAHIAADANMAWAVPQALDFARRVGPGVLDYLEQPVADDDLPGMAVVQAEAPFDLCLDEGLHGLQDIDRAADLQAARGVGLKAIKLGGALGVMRAEARCTARGMAQTLACKISETSIGAATTAHLACLLHDVGWGVSVTAGALMEEPCAPRILPQGGMLRPPPGPGLGVVPDLARLLA
ncbi:mandelate racemase/muconate lactonizing enzyme family protein [Falsiroseomonas selenitidurans]|uniref:Mandelate racemase/muconate lactonizing enzyme family protein n=1 Tax=Falsiroseomonas selenitidurans TaxID=2716335 RepID=A0ABX1EBS1_9PROT|nr:mandelate racemase/muconate lactonizing enzyme family protein [Falsiroseomonas selenitidurans]NKC34260.1 mandelate racemase/muconate lactonizing enzyme family protein [Falsiroseomonas selenitidurans]